MVYFFFLLDRTCQGKDSGKFWLWNGIAFGFHVSVVCGEGVGKRIY